MKYKHERKTRKKVLAVSLAVILVITTFFMNGGGFTFAETTGPAAAEAAEHVDQAGNAAVQEEAGSEAEQTAGPAEKPEAAETDDTAGEADKSAEGEKTAPAEKPSAEKTPAEEQKASETERKPQETAGKTGTDAAGRQDAKAESAEAGKEDPAADEKEDADKKDAEPEGASFSKAKGKDVFAVTLQGKAAASKAAAGKALRDDTDLSAKEIKEITGALFSSLKPKADSDDPYPSKADGSQIESITARWITEDTVDNDDADLLYLRPSGSSAQEVRLQINYALSGEHNYDPGDITITIPASIFKTRSGKNAGSIIIPFPEDPARTDDFNWKLIGDHYVLTNTKKMSAATKGYVQFAFTGLTPYDIQDMAVSDTFDAYIQVLTHKDNTIASRSNGLTAQLDTKAELQGVTKKVYGAPSVVKASAIPASQRIPGVEDYVKVDWYVWGDISANTMYTIDQVDTIPDEYNGFIIGATSADGRTLERKNVYTGHASGQGSSYSFSTAYPADQFEPDTDYTFHNTVSYTVTEKDPDADVTNPNVGGGVDKQLVTTGSASAKAVYSYTDPKWIDPTGHYMMVKNGNDGTLRGNTTRNRASGAGDYSDKHIWSRGNPIHGWYGVYPSAINQLQDEYAAKGENGSVALSYTINSVGYVMPWMFDSASYETDGELAPRKSVNYTRPVTMTTQDTGVRIGRNGDLLKVGEDYDLVSVEFPDSPYVYKGTPHNINPDGTWTAMNYGDGTFLYTRDTNKANWPDIKLFVEVGGTWQEEPFATASWKTGNLVITKADGTTQSAEALALPKGTTNFRTVVTLQNTGSGSDNTALQAAMDYDLRAVIDLKSTDALMELVDEAFEKSNIPEILIWNNANMTVWNSRNEGESLIVSIDDDGYDAIRGYTTDASVYPYKSASQSLRDVDYVNRNVIIHYNARVEERGIINDKVTYEQAIADKRLLAETSGVWRDLLPKGVTPLKDTVKLRSGDRVVDVRTIEDYKGSGRTLLIVECELTPVPERYRAGDTYYYEDVPRISFDAVYSFESIKDYGSNIHNVIAFESGNDAMGTIENYCGETDDPDSGRNISTARAFQNAAEKKLMTDLDPDRDDPNFVYAGVTTRIDYISAARTSLSKDVTVNNDGRWSDGVYYGDKNGNGRDAYTGGLYTYRLRMMSDEDTISKDLVLFDLLERFQAGDGNDDVDIGAEAWRGTLLGVDVSQLTDKGCAPVVYYSTRDFPATTSDNDEVIEPFLDLSSSVWVRADTYTGDLADVTAVAIDASKRADGSDFELKPLDTAVALINMKAPSGSEAAALLDKDAHAYNNAYLTCTSIDKTTMEEDSDNFVRKDYTKVGLTDYELSAEKTWSDDNNRDGIRPESVTLRLFANGEDTGKTLVLPQTVADPDTGEESQVWSGTFDHLEYADADGKKINYTIKEDAVDGYSETHRTQGSLYKFTNSHSPEVITISGTKNWEGDTEAVRPESVRVTLYGNDKPVRTITVKPDEKGVWAYAFENVFKYEDGKEIVYRTEEVPVTSGAQASYTSSTEADGLTIVNAYHPYGDLEVSKTVAETTEAEADDTFTFTFTFFRTDPDAQEAVPVFDTFDYDVLDESGEVVSSGTVATNGTAAIKAGQRIHVKEIPEYVSYRVTEEEREGYLLTGSSGSTGTINPNQTAQAGFTNTYKAKGQINLEAVKTLKNKAVKRYQFHFELYSVTENEDGTTTEELIKTAGNDTPGADSVTYREDGTVESSEAPVYFSALKFTQADHGKTYRYKVVEVDDGKPGLTYDKTAYYVDVAVTDNGDGTLSIVPTYYKEETSEDGADSQLTEAERAEFVNEYKAEGEIVLRAWKELKGRDLKDGEFSFELLDEKGAVLQTAANSADGSVVFDPIKYTEQDVGKTYYYGVREIAGDDSTVNYDTTVFGYNVQIIDNEDGTLSVVQGFASPEWGEVDCEVCHNENSRASFDLGDSNTIYRDHPDFGDYYTPLVDAMFAAGAEPPQGPGTLLCGADDVRVLRAFNALLTYMGIDAKATSHDMVYLTAEQYGYGAKFTVGYYCSECGGAGVCPVCNGTGLVSRDFKAGPTGPGTSGYTWQTWTDALMAQEIIGGYSADPSAVKMGRFYARLCEIGTVTTAVNGVYTPGHRYWYLNGIPYSSTERAVGAYYEGADAELAAMFGLDPETETRYELKVSVMGYGHGGCTYMMTASCGIGAPCTECTGSGKHLGIVGWTSEEGTLPLFRNTLKPGGLTVSKYTEDAENADPNQEFRFRVNLIGDGIPDGEKNYTLSQAPEKDRSGSDADNGTSGPGRAAKAARQASGQAAEGMQATLNTAESSALPGTGGTVKAPLEAVVSTDEKSDALQPKAANPDDIFYVSAESGPWGVDVHITRSGEMIIGNGGYQVFDMGSGHQDILAPWDGDAYGYSRRAFTQNVKSIRVNGTVKMKGSCNLLFDLRDIPNCETIDLTGMDFSGVSDMSWMIAQGGSLKKVTFGETTTAANCTMYQLFVNDFNITEIDMSGVDFSKVTNMQGIFVHTTRLQKVSLSDTFRFRNGAILNTPPTNAQYTGRWTRDDGYYAGTAAWLRDHFTAAMAGTYVWEETAIPYTVKYTAAGATGSMAQDNFDSKKEEKLTANRFVKYGYDFDHWVVKELNGNPVSDGKEYADKAAIAKGTYAKNDVVTLEAVFKPRNTVVNIQDGTFEFTLRGGERATFDDFPAGTAYQVWEETPDGWTLIEQKNTSGTIVSTDYADASFTNKYQPGTTTVQFSGTKKLDGTAAPAGAYQFSLTETGKDGEAVTIIGEDGTETEAALPLTVSNANGGFVQFPIIVYGKEDVGTHVYTIEEVDPNDDKIDYDTHQETVTVTVSEDKETGRLTSETVWENGSNSFAFNNKTRPGILKIAKSAYGLTDANQDDVFTFKVTFHNEKGMPFGKDQSVYWYTLDASGNVVRKATSELEPDKPDNAADDVKDRAADEKVEEEAAEESTAPAEKGAAAKASDAKDAAGSKAAEQNAAGGSAKAVPAPTSPAKASAKAAPAIKAAADSSLVSRAASEPFHATDDMLVGKAYAVITDDGDMIFFRSENNYTAGTGQTVTDIKGNTYTGEIFTDFENVTTYGLNGTRVPWYSRMTNAEVKTIRVAEGQAIRPRCTSTWFRQGQNYQSPYHAITSLESLDLNGLDTSRVTNMSHMFANCGKLTSLDVSTLDTSNVTRMDNMFALCEKLTALDLSMLDLSSVYTMQSMFDCCYALKDLNVRGLDVSHVRSFDHTFVNCYGLEQLDLTSWDTSSATTMRYMFENCRSLKSLDLSNFNTSRVNGTGMEWMFYQCRSLVSLDVSNFNTSAVNDMTQMFGSCTALTELDLSSFDTGAATRMGYMFNSCNNLRRVVLGPKFKFKGRYISSSSLWAELPNNGNWVREDGQYGPWAPATLRDRYSSYMEGVWILDLNNYSGVVRFDANGGFTAAGNVKASSASQSIDIPGEDTTKRPGYTLLGWSTERDGSGRMYAPGTSANDVVQLGKYVTLYAQWNPEGTQVVKVYHYQQKPTLDGYVKADYEVIVDEPGTVVTPAVKSYPEDAAYRGFKSPEAQTVTIAEDDAVVVEYYYDRMQYKVAFDGNGATSGQMKKQTFVSGVAQNLSKSAFQKEGSVFLGWSTDPDATEPDYTDRQSVKDLAEEDGSTVTLYAVWLSNEDSELTPQNGVIYVTCKANETIVIPDLPAGTTYTIEETDLPDGWTYVGSYGDTDKPIAPNTENTVRMYNDYSGEGEAYLTAHKRLNGEELEEGAFTFELLDSGKNVIQSKTNGEVDETKTIAGEDGEEAPNPWLGTAPVHFDPLTFNHAGTYTYYIREKVEKDGIYVYDDHLETVRVIVTDAGHGMLSCEVKYDDDGALFENEMKPGSLKVSKTVTGGDSDEEFEFQLEVKDQDGKPLDGPFDAKLYHKDYQLDRETGSATKYSHMDNVNDSGEKLRDYANGASYNDVVTIPGAKTMHVKLTWSTEGANWDWACMWAGNHPEYTAYANVGSSLTGRLGGGRYTDAANTREYDVEGDSVTFGFRSDSSYCGDGYGYYAVITADYVIETETGCEDTTVKDGTFRLKDGETIEIKGLPHGATYTVTEKPKAKWQLTDKTGDTGTIRATETAEAAFTNKFDDSWTDTPVTFRADIGAVKRVEGGTIKEEDEFLFELLDEEGNVLQSKYPDEFGKASSTITFDPIYLSSEDLTRDKDEIDKIAEKKLQEYKAAYEAYAEEAEAAGETVLDYDAYIQRETGMSADALAKQVTKEAETSVPRQKTFVYTLREVKGTDPNVTYDGKELICKVKAVLEEDGTISTDVSYWKLGEEIEEEDGTVTFRDEQIEQAEFVNEKTAKLKVEKQDAETGDTLKDAVFTIRKTDADETLFLQKDGSLGEEPYEFTTGEDGTFTVKNVKAGEYTLTEKEPPKGYKRCEDVAFSVADGAITRDGETVKVITVEDEREYAELTIEKIVDRYEASAPATFVFRIIGTLNGETVYDDVTSITFTNAGTERKVIRELPVGAEYTVTEIGTGSSYKAEGGTVKVIPKLIGQDEAEEGINMVTFTNSYDDKPKRSYGATNTFRKDGGTWNWENADAQAQSGDTPQ